MRLRLVPNASYKRLIKLNDQLDQSASFVPSIHTDFTS
jgi:hypothetical protein